MGGRNARLEFKNSWHPKCNGWIDHWDNYVTFRECKNTPCRLQSSFFLRFPPIISTHRFSFWQPGPWIFVPPLLFVCPVSQRSVVTGERASSFSVWSGDWDSALFGWAQLAAALQQRSSSSTSLQWTIYRRPRFYMMSCQVKNQMWKFKRVILVGMHPNFLNTILDDVIVWCDASFLWQVQLLLVRDVFLCYASNQLILIFVRRQETSGKIR